MPHSTAATAPGSVGRYHRHPPVPWQTNTPSCHPCWLHDCSCDLRRHVRLRLRGDPKRERMRLGTPPLVSVAYERGTVLRPSRRPRETKCSTRPQDETSRATATRLHSFHRAGIGASDGLRRPRRNGHAPIPVSARRVRSDAVRRYLPHAREHTTNGRYALTGTLHTIRPRPQAPAPVFSKESAWLSDSAANPQHEGASQSRPSRV